MAASHPVNSGMDVNEERLLDLSPSVHRGQKKKSSFHQEITDCNCIIESAERNYQGKKLFTLSSGCLIEIIEFDMTFHGDITFWKSNP